jgi:hypothetical protein
MNLKLLHFLAMATLVANFLFPGSGSAGTQPPAEGDRLPSIDLAVPQSAEYRQYLGISGKNAFTVPEIKAEVVLIEIFSMY